MQKACGKLALMAPLHPVDVEGGILIAMWNYMGWDNLSTIADEVDRPQRTYPLAMFSSVILVIASYLLPVMAVAVARVDPGIWSTGSWVDAGQGAWRRGFGAGDCRGRDDRRFGDFREPDAVIYKAARRDGNRRVPAPHIFARHQQRTGAPWVAIIACGIAWAACLPLGFFRLLILDVLLTGLSILLEFWRTHRPENS